MVCPLYQTAKWNVEGLTEVLAKEVRPLRSKLTIIEPAGINPRSIVETLGHSQIV